MKYYVLFTLMTSGPSSQWCESYRDFLIAIRTHTLSSLCASAYITPSAQTASHILLFFLRLANFHPFINRKTITQTIKLLLILTCLVKCNLALKSFPELIPPSLPPSPCARISTAGLLALCLYSGMLSLSYYCPFPPLWREESPLFFHFMIQCLTHTRHSRICFQSIKYYICMWNL